MGIYDRRNVRGDSGDVKEEGVDRKLPAYDLYQYPLFPSTVELSVKDLFPWAKVELAIRDRRHDLPSHDRSLQMGVSIILAHIMAVAGHGLMGSELFEPHVEIVVQAGFVVVDEDGRRYVHRIYEYQAVGYPALP